MTTPTPTASREFQAAASLESLVTAHRTTPDRTVFTESDNSDGWIATDLTVELEQ